MWKKRLQILLWCLLGCGCMVLLVAAIQVKNSKTCSGVIINIDSYGERVFINEKDIEDVLKANNVIKGTPAEDIDLSLVEDVLKKNAWIKDAQLFFDNNQVLTVNITERQPVARIFTVDGNSFYIDTAGTRLPLSEKFSARVPVFTSYPAEKKVMTGEDSAAAQDVRKIAKYIQNDSFWMAQVAQVDITPQHTYEMIPVLGNQVIRLGNADDIDGKFKRLLAFYKQVWNKTGFEKYSVIDVQYQGQVVAVRKGEAVPAADSTAAMQQFTGGAVLHSIVKDTLYAGAERRNIDSKTDSTANTHAVAAAAHKGGKKTTAGNKGNVKQAKTGKGKKKAVMLAKHY
ncbi:MAG TPA: hypothetical protein VG738_11555 [Chitinophagaceae bacterium]|nr:hypothetical protein [Chitinophagaceae bacterium]